MNKEKTGMEEMIEELGLQGCLIQGEEVEISSEKIAILNAIINEDVRQNEEAIREGEKILYKRHII